MILPIFKFLTPQIYLSYNTNMSELISGPNIPTMKLVHEDYRRVIREVVVRVPDKGVRRVTDIAIREGGGVLGNHYHTKPEYFSVISGNPTVYTAPSSEPTNMQERSFPEGGHIVMAPGETHTFKFEGPGHLISTMEGEYDPADTVPQKLAIPQTSQNQRD